MSSDLIYDVKQRPPFWQNFVYALQQFFAIIASTMLVPVIADKTGIYLSQSSALIGAGVGTIVYLVCTEFKSPVLLGSSFAYITPLATAVSYGYFGIILGSIFSALVYVVIAIIVKFVGSNWINKLMPPVITGSIVALIGFDLSSSAVSNIVTNSVSGDYSFVSILVGIITFLVVVYISVKGKKLRMFPFIIGILVGYVVAVILTGLGSLFNCEELILVDFSPLQKISNWDNWIPNLTFAGLAKEGTTKITSFGDIATIFVAFTPIAMVSFAEHIADHKNISSIIDRDLLKDPGLDKTLCGDGLGSFFGALFGGCPNTTYGESIGCVALSKNASTWTIFTASIMCIVVAYIYPVIAFVETIPSCVVGGVSVSLYGFIIISGMRMLKVVNLNDTKNFFVISAIFITGIGKLELKIGSMIISNIACALVLGIITNCLLGERKSKKEISENPDLVETRETVPEENKN